MMRMRSFHVLLFVAVCTALLSCSSDNKSGDKKTVTAKVQSAPYELLVVADKGWLKTGAGQSLVEIVESPIAGLPQLEPQFRVTYIDPRSFDGVFKTYANIVMAKVGSQYSEPRMLKQENVYARPQVVVHLYAPDDRTFEAYVAGCGPRLLAMLNQNEFVRERSFLRKHYSGIVQKQTLRQFGVDIHVPSDIDDIKQGKHFFWASASKQEFRQNVCLYQLPMQDLTVERLAVLRDSVMRVNIPGGRDDQWMETDMRTVVSDTVVVDGRQVLALRGLWDMRNDAMGGPFVSYVHPTPNGDSILVAEGFVFAPEEKKRPIIRQLEAALQIVKWSR